MLYWNHAIIHPPVDRNRPLGEVGDLFMPARRERRDLHLRLVPWENVFVYGDIEKANKFFPQTGFIPRFCFHGCIRLAVKLDFIGGLPLKAVEATGTNDFRGLQAEVGEVLAWRNMLWGLASAMAREPDAWKGSAMLPNMDYAMAYRLFSTIGYGRVKEIIEHTVASGLIYVNSNARDFKNSDIRRYLEQYVRGSNGIGRRRAGQAHEAAFGRAGL